MTDGHTKQGGWTVRLELTEDMVQQLTRLLDLAKLISGKEPDARRRPERFDILAYRAFLEEILFLLQKAMKEQRPFSSSRVPRQRLRQ